MGYRTPEQREMWWKTTGFPISCYSTITLKHTLTYTHAQTHRNIGKSGKIQTAGYIGLTEPIFLFTTPFFKTHWNEKSNVKIKINWHFLWKDRRVYHQSTRTVRNLPMIQKVGIKLTIKHNIPDHKMTLHSLRENLKKRVCQHNPTRFLKWCNHFSPPPPAAYR